MDKEELQLVKEKWGKLVKLLAVQFDEEPDLQVILFLIGVQEFGEGRREFSKDEKQNLMHVATCTVLSELGYYEFEKKDEEGWKHFRLVKPLPPMSLGEQDLMLRKGVLKYFEKGEIL